MTDAVKRVEAYLVAQEKYTDDPMIDIGYEGTQISVKDIRAIIEENKRFREALEFVSWAHASRRNVFIDEVPKTVEKALEGKS